MSKLPALHPTNQEQLAEALHQLASPLTTLNLSFNRLTTFKSTNLHPPEYRRCQKAIEQLTERVRELQTKYQV